MSRTPAFPQAIPRPWADSGNRRNIPDVAGAHGAASWQQGFPTETQLPMNAGGVAPNRLDFQGIFHAMTTAIFWQQSGGQWVYSATLGYTVPSIVFHDGKLWWCIAENGPESSRGSVTPGSNAAVWQELISALASMNGQDVFADKTPVGTVITYYGTTAPAGYLACNGASFSATKYPKLHALLGAAKLPDLRGYFVRGYDTRNSVDPSGASRALGSIQQDAIRNITGSVDSGAGRGQFGECTGAFYNNGVSLKHGSGTNNRGIRGLNFDVSRVVPTAAENRPKNICLLYCIKHD